MTSTSAGVSRRLPGRARESVHEGPHAIAVRDPMLVAAPASAVDPLTPWVEPVTSGDRAVSTTFWMSFHGLSAFAHSVAIFLAFAGTLMPIPFIAAMCSDVKPVEKPIERVELAVVDVPKPPPPPVLALADGGGEGVALKSCLVDADCADNEECIEKVCVASTQKHKKKITPKKKGHARKTSDEPQMMMLIGSLSSDNDNGVFATLSSSADLTNALDGLQGVAVGGVEGGVVGGVVGGVEGVGGLGVRGEGGGGRGESIGLGTIGTLGHGSGGGGELRIGGGGSGRIEPQAPSEQVPPPPAMRLTVNGNLVDQPGVARMLSTCHVDAPISGTLTIGDTGKPTRVTTSPANPCVERRLKIGLRLVDFESSDVAYTVAPAAP